ncbi:hypothetical protein HNP46_006044 [Pseudomonas nitritireducens]|uniref:Uncharacterized protein n=1 Tax=Pseudomonas nitroreducens TaxID=46680 RepID=A0A7W7KRF8_PSENT|nr:hypothetical protein [Pseudomonas nitritireducens]MBB4867133.1 hypothetical protein [Pseudomonas nitritireducens]
MPTVLQRIAASFRNLIGVQQPVAEPEVVISVPEPAGFVEDHLSDDEYDRLWDEQHKHQWPPEPDVYNSLTPEERQSQLELRQCGSAKEAPAVAVDFSQLTDVKSLAGDQAFERLCSPTTWEEYDQLPDGIRYMGKYFMPWDEFSSGFIVAISPRLPVNGGIVRVTKAWGDSDQPFQVRFKYDDTDKPDAVMGEFASVWDALAHAVVVRKECLEAVEKTCRASRGAVAGHLVDSVYWLGVDDENLLGTLKASRDPIADAGSDFTDYASEARPLSQETRDRIIAEIELNIDINFGFVKLHDGPYSDLQAPDVNELLEGPLTEDEPLENDYEAERAGSPSRQSKPRDEDPGLGF